MKKQAVALIRYSLRKCTQNKTQPEGKVPRKVLRKVGTRRGKRKAAAEESSRPISGLSKLRKPSRKP